MFRKNVLGDVTHIYKLNSGKLSLAAKYKYDAWGKCEVENVAGETIGDINPIRYRGYYYDTETKLYYLKTRYYDPEIGRFISADDTQYLDLQTINGFNLFIYCGNNPVMNVDENGNSWKNFWKGVGNWFKKNWAKVVSAAMIVVGVVTLFIPGAQGVSGLLLSAGVSSLVGGYANEAAGGHSLLAG